MARHGRKEGGEGWEYDCLSDDSSFYGDDDLRAELEQQSAKSDVPDFRAVHAIQFAALAATARTKDAENRRLNRPLYNAYEGDLNGRQLSETVSAFLARCPPLTTHISIHGPWLYIGNPYTTYRRTNENIPAFKARGRQILDEFDSIRAGIEASLVGKSKATITRNLTPPRKQVQIKLLAAAKENGCTTGKWMLFPNPDQVNSSWSRVATATADDELGIAAKVGTDEGDPNKVRLICVYTVDFEDKKDVKRVLEKLYEMGLCNRNGAMAEGKAIYYKADAYTYLDILGGNEWGLKASLYSSRESFGEGD